MMNVSFYHKDTGLFNGVLFTSSDESTIALNTPPDHVAIEGHHSAQRKRVDIETGNVVEYVPPAPSSDHEWHDNHHEWRLKPEVALARQCHETALVMIRELERHVQPRLLREVCLGDPDALGRLKELDSKIAILRKDIIK